MKSDVLQPDIEEELSSSTELTSMPPRHGLDRSPIGFEAGQPPSDRSISPMASLGLTFVLLLSLWDTWSTMTNLIAPIPDHLPRRLLLNTVLCVGAKLMIQRRNHGRVALFANLLLGMGAWEMAESVIEVAFGSSEFLKLLFYITCLCLTSLLVFYLETWKGLNVLDNESVSPI